jgi:hypothetical protein
MPPYISDEVLHTFVTIGTYDTIAGQLLDRFGGCITDCEFSIAVKTETDKELLRGLATSIQSRSLDRARNMILGTRS